MLFTVKTGQRVIIFADPFKGIRGEVYAIGAGDNIRIHMVQTDNRELVLVNCHDLKPDEIVRKIFYCRICENHLALRPGDKCEMHKGKWIRVECNKCGTVNDIHLDDLRVWEISNGTTNND